MEMLEFVLPSYDWNYFEVTNTEETENTDPKTNHIYKKRLLVTIQERNIVPEELGNSNERHSHGFVPSKQYEDYPIRDKVVTIIEKKRRRKNIKTGKTIVSKKPKNILEEGTKVPKDLLYFLK